MFPQFRMPNIIRQSLKQSVLELPFFVARGNSAFVADVLQVSKLPFFAGMFLAWTEPRGLSLVDAIVGTV